MPGICLAVPRQIKRSRKGKRHSQFLNFKSGHKYKRGQNSAYQFSMYYLLEPKTTWSPDLLVSVFGHRTRIDFSVGTYFELALSVSDRVSFCDLFCPSSVVVC